jgi:hypothetical protein
MPNRSTGQYLNSASNDSWIIPTPEKRQIASPSTPNSSQKPAKKYLLLKIGFPYFRIRPTYPKTF